MTAPKAQHYIPQFYLRGFTDKQGNLWVYERFRPMKKSKPKLEAHELDYYTHDEQGERDETAEDVLQGMESRVAPIIKGLANRQYTLSPENAAHLIIFAVFMFTRVPSWREHIDNFAAELIRRHQLRIAGDKEKFNVMCESLEKTQGHALGIDREQLRQYVLKGEYQITQGSKAYNLGRMFKSGFSILEEVQNWGYQGLYAPDDVFFMTSDSPVYTVLPDGKGEVGIGMGFGWPGVELIFPLNKKTCLRMKKGITPKGRLISKKYVDAINLITMTTAAHHLYSSQGYKRIARLFDERGCKVKAGKNSFMSKPVL